MAQPFHPVDAQLLFRHLSEQQTLVGIYLIQHDRFLYMNEAGAALFGYRAAEVCGRMSPAQLVAPEDRDLVAENLRRRLSGEVDAVHYLFHGLRKDGSTFVCEALGQRIEYQGHPAVFGTLLDATASLHTSEQQRRTNQDLLRRNQELETIASISQQLTRTLDLQEVFRILYRSLAQDLLNAPHLTIARYDPQAQVIWCEYAVVDGKEADVAQFPSLPINRGPTSETIRTRTPRVLHLDELLPQLEAEGRAVQIGDERRPRSALLVPLIRDEKVTGVFTVESYEPDAFDEVNLEFVSLLANQASIAIENARLLAQTQQLLEATTAQSQQLRQLMDATPEGLVLLDAEGRVLLCNPQGEQLLALLADTHLGETVHALAGVSLHELAGQTTEGQAWREFILAEGAFQAAARSVSAEGTDIGWVLVLRDVTEEHRKQEHQQTERRLATVGQLAAGIAHDFNNILEVILLYGQMLEENPELPDRRRYLRTINRQARHAANLVRQILDFSRQAIMQTQEVDLTRFVYELAGILERILPESIRIHTIVPSHPLLVMADPGQLQQAIINLAINARDAMPQGGDLTFQLEQVCSSAKGDFASEAAAGPWARLRVQDAGQGMTPDVLAHAFEPFFTTKPPGEGSGLGLAQAYGIIKQHKGEITVESQPGAGTTFTILLPVTGPSNEIGQPADGESSVVQASPEGFVLVVEDDERTRQAVREAVELLGYRTLGAQDGKEALRIFQQRREDIELVLSDMVMPESDGLDLYRKLRALDPEARLVIMTGYPLRDAGKSLLAEGVMAWLQKPFSIGELAATLRTAREASGPSPSKP